MKIKRKHFAAYGSCTNVNQMSSICPEAFPFAWGVAGGFELEFRTYANIKKSKGLFVPIVLWSITAEDEEALDSCENMALYRKELINVKITDVNDRVSRYYVNHYREGIDALVYIMKDKKLSPVKAPSLEYYQSILEGYQDNDINIEPLEKAMKLTRVSSRNIIRNNLNNIRGGSNVEKPTAMLVGANGNIFNLIGIASKALKKAGQREQANEMQKRISSDAKNYDEALQIIMEYVEVD